MFLRTFGNWRPPTSALMGLNKNEKLQAMAPLKIFLPSWKEKGTIEKMKKRLHQYYT
jgi:hypothetical protein